METLSIFQNDSFGSLRTVNIDDTPWFVGKDVAEMLGYGNTKDAILKHVDPDDRKVLKAVDFPERSQNATFEIPPRGLTIINESGLYSLILSSKLPQARQFKHWVTSEVLPAIRNHGFYATPETVSQFLANPDAMITVLRQISDERSAHLARQEELLSLRAQLDSANAQIASAPSRFMVRAGDPRDDTSSIASIAQFFTDSGFPISRNRLFAILRSKGLIRPDSPLPTFEGIKSGCFLIVEHRSPSATYYTTGVTTLGRLRFYDFCDDLIAARKRKEVTIL